MRHLAAEQTSDLGRTGLHLQSLEIVGRADQVELGRHLVGGAVVGIEPVAREDGQLAIGGEFLQALLHLGEVAVHGRASLLGQRVGIGDVCRQSIQRVDVVERRQVVEPQDVAVQELRALDEVADDACVVRDGDAVRLLGCDGRRMRVRNRANAADALNDLGCILGSAMLDNPLHAAEATAGHPCIDDLAALDFHLATHVSFDAGNRIDYGTCHVAYLPSSVSVAASTASSASATTSAAGSSTASAPAAAAAYSALIASCAFLSLTGSPSRIEYSY